MCWCDTCGGGGWGGGSESGNDGEDWEIGGGGQAYIKLGINGIPHLILVWLYTYL